jgi:uncharacterized membrane protein YjgN (DUF898 family)
MKFKIEIKWAIIYFVMTIAWSALGKLLGFHSNRIEHNVLFNGLVIFPSFAVYLFALLDKRKNYFDGTMTFRQGFVSGMILTVFVTILGPLTPLISIGLISPDLFQNAIEFVVSNNIMTQEEANNQFNMPAFIIQGVIAAPIFGLPLSLICAFFTRKQMHSNVVELN